MYREKNSYDVSISDHRITVLIVALVCALISGLVFIGYETGERKREHTATATMAAQCFVKQDHKWTLVEGCTPVPTCAPLAEE